MDAGNHQKEVLALKADNQALPSRVKTLKGDLNERGGGRQTEEQNAQLTNNPPTRYSAQYHAPPRCKHAEHDVAIDDEESAVSTCLQYTIYKQQITQHTHTYVHILCIKTYRFHRRSRRHK